MTFGSRQSATWWQLDYNSQDRYAYGQGFSQQYYANWPRVVTDQAGVTLDVGNDVLDRWYCMTFVVNTGANVGCFIDGVVAPEFDSFEISFAGPMGYGGASTIKIGHGLDGYFDGTIGMICQWMRSLTDREVLQAYNAYKGIFCKMNQEEYYFKFSDHQSVSDYVNELFRAGIRTLGVFRNGRSNTCSVLPQNLNDKELML